MTPAEETRLRAVEERAKRAIDFHFREADWTRKKFKRILNMIFGLTVAHVLELLLILALLAND